MNSFIFTFCLICLIVVITSKSLDETSLTQIKAQEHLKQQQSNKQDLDYDDDDDDDDDDEESDVDVKHLEMEGIKKMLVQTTKKKSGLNLKQNLIMVTKPTSSAGNRSVSETPEVATKKVTYHHYAEEPPTSRSWYQREIWKLVKYSTPPTIFDYELNDTFYDDRLSEPMSRLSRRPRDEVIWEEPVFKTGNCWLAALLSGSLANFSPSCTKNGFYTSKQCFLERCWCATHFGQPIKKIFLNGHKVGWALLHWSPAPENNMDESFFSYGYKAVKMDCDEILEEYRQEYVEKMYKEAEMLGDNFSPTTPEANFSFTSEPTAANASDNGEDFANSTGTTANISSSSSYYVGHTVTFDTATTNYTDTATSTDAMVVENRERHLHTTRNKNSGVTIANRELLQQMKMLKKKNVQRQQQNQQNMQKVLQKKHIGPKQQKLRQQRLLHKRQKRLKQNHQHASKKYLLHHLLQQK